MKKLSNQRLYEILSSEFSTDSINLEEIKSIVQELVAYRKDSDPDEILNDGICQWCGKPTDEAAQCPDNHSCGETFTFCDIPFYVGWMKSKPGQNSYGMWINEQPNGGFRWEFLDFKPASHENYSKIFITPYDFRTISIQPEAATEK